MKNDRLYLFFILAMLMVILAWLMISEMKSTKKKIKNVERIEICQTMNFLKVC